MSPESYRIRRNNVKWGPLCRSRSFKVTEFGTSRESEAHIRLPINEYYWMNTTTPILHRYRDIWLIIGQIFASDRESLHFNALAGVIPANIWINFTSPKLEWLSYLMLKTTWSYVYSAVQNTGTWQTDRRTDGQPVTMTAVCIASNADAL